MRRTTTLVLAVGALTLAACGGADSSPHAAATTVAPVPWADLPPTHPHLASTRLAPRPDPARAAAARPCRAADLDLRDLGNGAAMGTTVKALRFSLADGHRPCSVSGRPGATLRMVEGDTLPGVPSTFTSRYSEPVLLTHRADALAQLVWPSACLAPSGRAAVTLTYARRAWAVPMGSISDTCDFGADRPLHSIGITRFFPPHVVRGRRETAYAPYRDARGRPHLPAGRPVGFELRLAPVEALQRYWWEIVAPGREPHAAGVITLR
ncbi:DUF4232 domain-containing protein [Nocardioides cynanchi]|uniref:DUF4232 domain-containing protein n=1 Tax=Nocardioides cynanchi TaxID=2558918 RepID=UPI0012456335|nr:DUF4232 domain-containing protein [Nocardioides cynanchi]